MEQHAPMVEPTPEHRAVTEIRRATEAKMRPGVSMITIARIVSLELANGTAATEAAVGRIVGSPL